MQKLLLMIEELILKIKGLVKDKNLETQAGELLYRTALSFIGTDPTPRNEVDNDVACAASLNAIHTKAFGEPIGGGASTYWLYFALKNHKKFTEVTEPKKGDVILCYTGQPGSGQNGVLRGHTGIVSTNGQIMSNTSATGLWQANYNLFSWTYRWGTLGKYKIYYFRRVLL